MNPLALSQIFFFNYAGEVLNHHIGASSFEIFKHWLGDRVEHIKAKPVIAMIFVISTINFEKVTPFNKSSYL